MALPAELESLVCMSKYGLLRVPPGAIGGLSVKQLIIIASFDVVNVNVLKMRNNPRQ